MKLPSVDKSKMAPSKMTGWSLRWLYLSYDSTQKGVVYVVRAYGSINAIDSVKLTSVIFLIITRWRYPRWMYPNWRAFCCLAPMQHFVAQLHSITIFEDNRYTFRFTTRQPLRIHCPGRRPLPKFKNLLP